MATPTPTPTPTPRVTYYRWFDVPPLLGCRWCGIRLQTHNVQTTPGHPDHVYELPTTTQMQARFRARHARKRRSVVSQE